MSTTARPSSPAASASPARARLIAALDQMAEAMLDVLREERAGQARGLIVAELLAPGAAVEVREAVARLDGEDTWMGKAEAMRWGGFACERTFRRWVVRHEVRVSHSKGRGSPEYQLASLRAAKLAASAPAAKGKAPALPGNVHPHQFSASAA